jgi:hypothetical protein
MPSRLPLVIVGGQKQRLQPGDDLLVPDSLIVGEDIGVTGSISVGMNLDVIGDTALNGDLTVDGESEFNDDVVINGDLTVNGLVAGNFVLNGQEIIPTEYLTADFDIYVSPTGDDDTGDGSLKAPFKTIQRAAERYVVINPQGFTITIHLEPGVNEHADQFTTVYPFGSNLIFQGDRENFTSPALSNFGASYSTDMAFSGLQYFDFDIELSGAVNVDEGSFVLLRGVTGGTNPAKLDGLHRIESWDPKTEIATCRVWSTTANSDLPSGSPTVASAVVFNSVLKFTGNNHFLQVAGPYHMGQWDNLVLEGNADTFAGTFRAIDFFGGATFRSVLGIGFHSWGRTLNIFGESVCYIQSDCGISKSPGPTIQSIWNSLTRFTSGVINGISGNAIQATQNATCVANSTRVHSIAGTVAQSTTRSYIEFTNGVANHGNGSSAVLAANTFGDILRTGFTSSGFGAATTATQGRIEPP